MAAFFWFVIITTYLALNLRRGMLESRLGLLATVVVPYYYLETGCMGYLSPSQANVNGSLAIRCGFTDRC